jgi:hypothetical protein
MACMQLPAAAGPGSAAHRPPDAFSVDVDDLSILVSYVMMNKSIDVWLWGWERKREK